jgi:hypothetical protein
VVSGSQETIRVPSGLELVFFRRFASPMTISQPESTTDLNLDNIHYPCQSAATKFNPGYRAELANFVGIVGATTAVFDRQSVDRAYRLEFSLLAIVGNADRRWLDTATVVLS